MSKPSRLIEETRAPKRHLLPSLVISRFAISPPAILTAYLLIDIGHTFGTPVGVTGQIRTGASLIGAITAVLMGAWSVRFKHKSLLLLGLSFLCISAIGCTLALNFTMMLIAFSLYGVGLAMVMPMIFALVGEHFPLEQRARAIGWLFTGGSLAFIISAPVIGVIAVFGGWRLAFLGVMFPAPLLSLMLTTKVVPPPAQSLQLPRSQRQYMEGFKRIFGNSSALACLISSALGNAAYQALELYGASFFRERFLVSLEFTSIYFLGGASSFVLGFQVSGRVINRFGRKPVMILTSIVAGICIISFMNMLNLWLFFVFAFLSCAFLGMMSTAASSLTLEQVPDFRGSMMSLNSTAEFMGAALGAGVGGFVLFFWNYAWIGLVLGTMNLIIAILVYFVIIDPTSTESYVSKS